MHGSLPILLPNRTQFLFHANRSKQAEAFDRLTKMHIVREHKGMLYLNETFREQYKSALTGG